VQRAAIAAGRDEEPENALVMQILDIPEGTNDNTCVICLTKERDSAFYPCGH